VAEEACGRREEDAVIEAAEALLRLARDIVGKTAEKELEMLLRALVPGTPFAGKVYAVGGYVRDELLGIESKDLDVVVETRGGAEKLGRHIHGLFPAETSTPRVMGAGYPIWQLAFKGDVEFEGRMYGTAGAVVELVDTQKESFPDPESRQRTVEYGTLQEDIERRDFTVNMLLKDLTTGEVKDLTGTSVADLEKGVLRGHPSVDFDKILSDDPLRMLRLVRFQVKYGWSVPMSVLKAVRRNAARIGIVSGERVRDELVKMMDLGKMAQAVRIMKATGLLAQVFPEVDAMRGVEHEYARGHHQEGDVLRHTLLVLQNAKPGVESQLAALLHDVGKPETQETVEGLIRFIGHEKVGGEMAEAIMRRLKFDKDVVRKVRTMVENHMKPHAFTRGEGGPKALRRFVRDVGEELVGAVLDLAEADQLGTLPPANMIPDLRKDIEAVMAPVRRAERLPLDGNDVQSLLGIGPGRAVGEAVAWLKDRKYEWELEGRPMSREDAEKLVLEQFGGRALS
jgi:poly(A) polymerase